MVGSYLSVQGDVSLAGEYPVAGGAHVAEVGVDVEVFVVDAALAEGLATHRALVRPLA